MYNQKFTKSPVRAIVIIFNWLFFVLGFLPKDPRKLKFLFVYAAREPFEFCGTAERWFQRIRNRLCGKLTRHTKRHTKCFMAWLKACKTESEAESAYGHINEIIFLRAGDTDARLDAAAMTWLSFMTEPTDYNRKTVRAVMATNRLGSKEGVAYLSFHERRREFARQMLSVRVKDYGTYRAVHSYAEPNTPEWQEADQGCRRLMIH